MGGRSSCELSRDLCSNMILCGARVFCVHVCMCDERFFHVMGGLWGMADVLKRKCETWMKIGRCACSLRLQVRQNMRLKNGTAAFELRTRYVTANGPDLNFVSKSITLNDTQAEELFAAHFFRSSSTH